MPLEGNHKLSSELEKILPSSFPEEQGRLEVVKIANDFRIETKTVSEQIEERESTHPLYQIFRKKNWKDLATNSEGLLNENSADIIARLYWISAQLHLKNIPSEIVAGSFLELVNSNEVHSAILEEHWGVISSIWMLTCESKNAIRLTQAYEQLAKLIPNRAESLYRNFLESQFVILSEQSRTATAQSEELRNLEYISKLRSGFHKKIQSDRIIPLKQSKKNNTFFLLLFFLTILLAVYIFQDNLFSSTVSQAPIADFKVDSQPKIKVAAVEQAKTQEVPITDSSGSSLDEVLLEIQKDRQTAAQLKADETVDLSIAGSAPQVIDLSNPKEPPKIAEMIESAYQENVEVSSEANTNNERGVNIVEGDNPYRPIVKGEALPGKVNNLYHLKAGDVLYVNKSTSLFAGPDEIEAELLGLRAGDRIVVIKDYNNWVRVEFAGRAKGFVKKIFLDVR